MKLNPAIDRPQKGAKKHENSCFHGFENWPSFTSRAAQILRRADIPVRSNPRLARTLENSRPLLTCPVAADRNVRAPFYLQPCRAAFSA